MLNANNFYNILCQTHIWGASTNGSASDSRSEGWAFESLVPHILHILLCLLFLIVSFLIWDGLSFTIAKSKECLTEIGKACAVKWVIRNTNKQPTNITAEEAKATGIKLCFSQKYSCHHWGTYESKATLHVVQKQTKKNKCPALLHVKEFFKTPEFYEFVVTKDHAEHTPDDIHSDICTLPLAKKYLHELAQQLEQSSKSASQIRIDMLRAVDRYGRKSERKFNYYDIWNLMNKLSDSVKIPGSLSSEAQILRSMMMKSLQEIIYEEDIDEFHHKIVQFKEEFDDQESFLDYFERNWCTEAKFKIWSRAYHERQFSHMLTNNYIESWHNQLKTVFMKRSRNKRLDKHVFVLVHDVEYYLTQEYERIMSNNGPMSSFTRQQRICEMEAEEVDDDDREMMIVAPGIAEDVNWQVQSFVNKNTTYVIQVAEPNLIISCTCFDYQQRYKPCKHMYLLKMHTNRSLYFSLPSVTSTNVIQLVSTSETATITPTISRTSAFIQQCIDINQTLWYANQDLLTMQQYMTEDDGQTLFDAYQHSLQVFQSIKNKYEVHLCRSHTQE
ncbi:hypothetical protein PHYBLDRAFT_68138 [Phycomyces blakesleeanus NRRL 1555(-)]|uniref:SWIM-type domain-containing protein n=1 Tax=Phycomyces blakesleeanus (strain ATCC 8743b / DSM 1359 / FGSC 10004 / NBRC 33097 / NRRL 1555) TaxID=763407 RepID=A0A162UQC9_PHYB8|nr:hypothetical protein PHYBLDRAFT_68138 [Phycomyces blakesleeanus NRRL 1555(-)]OAD77053.1 hypothetical protein PHYBLDRAFT_68138 [Phycomyces blakesleeanus NRRL 1555(-)]|eukprot:XP_018295093.1 hypothetical protein PHYBLDRAFT_68138 [Phycomyces blakesleeanus NRRL 1555(-)]